MRCWLDFFNITWYVCCQIEGDHLVGNVVEICNFQFSVSQVANWNANIKLGEWSIAHKIEGRKSVTLIQVYMFTEISL